MYLLAAVASLILRMNVGSSVNNRLYDWRDVLKVVSFNVAMASFFVFFGWLLWPSPVRPSNGTGQSADERGT
jgi:hypothetical protein